MAARRSAGAAAAHADEAGPQLQRLSTSPGTTSEDELLEDAALDAGADRRARHTVAALAAAAAAMAAALEEKEEQERTALTRALAAVDVNGPARDEGRPPAIMAAAATPARTGGGYPADQFCHVAQLKALSLVCPICQEVVKEVRARVRGVRGYRSGAATRAFVSGDRDAVRARVLSRVSSGGAAAQAGVPERPPATAA